MRLWPLVPALLVLGSIPALAAPEPIRVVIVGPENGDSGGDGQQEQMGARAAIRDLGEAVLGHPIRIEVFDDGCDADLSIAIAQKLVVERADVVIGPGCSTASLAAVPIFAAQNLLEIMPSSSNPVITELGIKTLFRMIGRDDRQGIRAAELMTKRWKHGRIALIDDGAVYGRGLADATATSLHASGIEPVLRADYRPGAANFRDLLDRLTAAHADVVFVGGVALDIALIAQQIRQAGLSCQIIGGDTLSDSEYWRLAGRAAEGTLFTFPPDLRNSAEAARVVARFRADGFEPEGYTLLAYAAVQVWAEAVAHANSLAGPAVAAALHSRRFATVLGPVSFDAKGDISGVVEDFGWYSWHDGKMITVMP